MKCSKCGKGINRLNHFYVPSKTCKEGFRYCITCAREEGVITLI